MNALDLYIESQANTAALLNVLMYLNIEDVEVSNNKTLYEIIGRLKDIYDKESKNGYQKYINSHEDGTEKDYADRQRQYQIIKNAIDKDTNLANMVINNQSRLMTNTSFDRGGLNACTFTDSKGNVFVVYRGTGSGEWVDNGIGLSGKVTDTEQQKEAMEYFNYIVEKNNYNIDKPNMIISGHSKGGNKAQYTTINSEYNDLIEHCFNFDGQGMSPEAIEEFKKRYGAGYEEAIKKMHGFYAENDFVNVLGIGIVPREQRYYFKSPIVNGIDDFVKNHYSDGYLNEDGSFSEQTKQGNYSKLLENYSKDIMSLPPEIRSNLTNSSMGIAQLLKKHETVNGESVSNMEWIVGFGLMYKGRHLPLIDLLGTSAGWGTMVDLVGDSLKTIEEKFEVDVKWIASVAGTTFAIMNAPKIIGLVGVEKFINICELSIEKLKEFGKARIELTSKMISAVNSFVQGIKTGFKENFSTGYKYASSNPHIKVNTYKLRLYADRLTVVNRRITNLDRRLDSLYMRVGLGNLTNLVKADALTGYSLQLSRCINYLNSTAEKFDRVERELMRQINGA